MRRRLLFTATLLILALVAVLVSLPWWFGGVLRHAGATRGFTFGAYQRLGYGRFALRDAEFKRDSVRVWISDVEADTPLLWLWRHVVGEPAPVAGGQWRVEVPPSSVRSQVPRSDSGWVPLQRTLHRVASKLDRWLPRAHVGPGSVQWPGGALSMGAATWERRELAAQAVRFNRLQADVRLTLSANTEALQLHARSADGEIDLRSQGEAVTGRLTWSEQDGIIAGRFGAAGWLPAEASLRARDWKVSGEKLKLAEFYSTVGGNVALDWKHETLRAEVAIRGDPLPDKKIPPLQAMLRGHGDQRAFTVEELRASLPGFVAELTEAVTVERDGKIRGTNARFTLQLDLEQQPWVVAKGRISGEATLGASVAQSATVDFSVRAADLTLAEIGVANANLEGRFEWPLIRITKAVMFGAAGDRVEGLGNWNMSDKEMLAARARGEIRRDTVARWVPPQLQFGALSFNVEAEGPLPQLRHRGEATAEGVSYSGTMPLRTKFQWRGTGVAASHFTGEIVAGETRVDLAGTASAQSLELSSLRLAGKESLLLQLVKPVTVRWKPELSIEGLHLAGNDAAIDAELRWGPAGKVAVAVRDVSSRWIAPLATIPGPHWHLHSLALQGAWDRGPMEFTAVVGGTIELADKRHAKINLSARGARDGIRVDALRVADGSEPIIDAVGSLPVVIAPGSSKLVAVDATGPVELDARTTPNAAFWGQLASLTGVDLKEPTVAAHIRGTWRQPEGSLQIKAARISLDPKRVKRSAPAMELLEVGISGDTKELLLEKFSVLVEGQAVSARGRLPLDGQAVGALFKTPLAFAKRGAELRLDIPRAELAAFTRILPAFMAPKGTLRVALDYKRGKATGEIQISDAATRPLGPLGVVQDVQAEVKLVNNVVELGKVTARSGGEEVRLAGRIELPEWDLASGGSPAGDPKYDLTLRGENLPFVRRTGLLLRGDLDLNLRTLEMASATLRGTVRLRESLFLQDVRALLPSGATGKARRPPYFAVENDPLREWLLDVTVEGDHFLRVRTALFNGVASARFHLGGTLGEPMALGDLVINEGAVRLPFATFDVREGRVTLTREQPYEPQLWLVGTSRRFNYDIRMEASGAAVAPLLTFSSSPPLEHGQVLLMVMTGQAPNDEIVFTDQQRAARLGTFLGQSLLASVGDADSAERLSISTGERISRQGRETYEFEYRLNEKWSVTGEYDEFDNYNAGVKWRVYSRGGERSGQDKDAKNK